MLRKRPPRSNQADPAPPKIKPVESGNFSEKRTRPKDHLPDLLIRLGSGIMIGCTLAMWFYFDGTTQVQIQNRWPGHPISNGAGIGFSVAVPICLIYAKLRKWQISAAGRRGLPAPPARRFLGRPALVFSFLITLSTLWFLDHNYFQ